MARKKKHEEHANHERWLVSYADFITLLFAFFVVMFAVSQVDTKKMGRFTESFNDALEWQVFDARGGKAILPGEHASTPSVVPTAGRVPPTSPYEFVDFGERKMAITKALMRRAAVMPELEGLKILDMHGELVIRLPERLIFDVGDAKLKPEGSTALHVIAEELKAHPVDVRVEGHTDSTPIHTDRFPSNWELSTARAMAVIAFFLEDGQLEPKRLAAAGYGEHHPAASNETAEGRAQNRRVDLIVVANIPAPEEPKR